MDITVAVTDVSRRDVLKLGAVAAVGATLGLPGLRPAEAFTGDVARELRRGGVPLDIAQRAQA